MTNSKIYTKTGDQGLTSLIGGKRMPKNDLRFHAYGTVDELNSAIGLAIGFLQFDLKLQPHLELQTALKEIQRQLFALGSQLACDDTTTQQTLPRIEFSDVVHLEKSIDQITQTLPELKHFILPGGALAASQLHVARTICRRAERFVVGLKNDAGFQDVFITYLNRLSDYLFVISRHVNLLSQIAETTWQK